VKVEGDLSTKDTSKTIASEPQVFMIFAALTVAGVYVDQCTLHMHKDVSDWHDKAN